MYDQDNMTVEIIPSPRIDFCGECGFEHGYNCPPKKVLFLDMDGVVNKKGTFQKYPNAEFPIDPYCAFLVGKIQLEMHNTGRS